MPKRKSLSFSPRRLDDRVGDICPDFDGARGRVEHRLDEGDDPGISLPWERDTVT